MASNRRQDSHRGILVQARQGRPEKRQSVVVGVVLIAMACCGLRLVQIQGLDPGDLAGKADQQSNVSYTVPAQRGQIVDTNGKILATSVTKYAITADQVELAGYVKKDGLNVVASGVNGAASALSPVLGMSVRDLTEILTGDKRFVYVTKDVTPEIRQQVRDLMIPGIYDERTDSRSYPQGSVAGNIIGFVGSDGTPLGGLELSENSILGGKDGKRSYQQGLGGQQIPSAPQEQVDAVDGRKIQLTIDSDLQWSAQEAIDAKVEEAGAQWGTVIVTDVKTGAILALADSNSLDPSDPGKNDFTVSKAVSSVFEPGSTGKVVTVSAALESGSANPLSQYTVDYTYTYDGQSFKDSEPHPRQQLTLAGVLSESSNVGTVMVGQKIPSQTEYNYLTKFGFGTKTGIEIPGESSGLLSAPDKWDGRTKYNVYFGQGYASTALQATQVYATIANGGVQMPLHVVESTTGEDGTVKETQVSQGKRVIKASTATDVLKMLESAVDNGTGTKAQVSGYRVAGKTGTAQVADEKGNLSGIVASFIGIAPADSPRIVVSVILYRPTNGVYGGALAAPVFSSITGKALQILGIPPSGSKAELFPTEFK